jgi:hypothetical protein
MPIPYQHAPAVVFDLHNIVRRRHRRFHGAGVSTIPPTICDISASSSKKTSTGDVSSLVSLILKTTLHFVLVIQEERSHVPKNVAPK